MTIRFDEALTRSVSVVRAGRKSYLADAGKVIIIRDLLGLIHLAFEKFVGVEKLSPLLVELRESAGPYFADTVFQADEMVDSESVFESVDLVDLGENVWRLERGVIGADWGRPLLPNLPPTPPRATLYGMKGGVGRSTALSVWARHLAELGKKVLVVDLDLEAPGVSSMLMPPGAESDYGLVDWFVEDAIGNADAELVRMMASSSPIAAGTEGKVLVAPCRGSETQNYMEKLARCYIDVPVRGDSVPRTCGFAERVGRVIDALESAHEPDVVLIDSRSGLHDLAAISTIRLGAMTFLFAVETRQTWDAYRILFEALAQRPILARAVRGQFQVVAAQVPETARQEYLAHFHQRSYDLFSETLYEETSDAPDDGSNFDIGAVEAPHHGLPIYWTRVMQGWDPCNETVPPEQIRAAFGAFLDRATELLIGES